VAGRNPDFRELSVRVSSGRELRFAVANGFRNIQTVINRMKKRGGGRSAAAAAPLWDYVEVMACPSGCVNGGGQQPLTPVAVEPPQAEGAAGAAPSPGAREPEPPVARISRLLHDRTVERPWESRHVAAIEAALVARGFTSEQRTLLMRTQFHHVPKLETTLIRW
jgi:hypothetical protein